MDDYVAVYRHGFGYLLYEELVEPVQWNNAGTYGPMLQGYTSWAGTWIRTGSRPVEQGWVKAEPWTPGKPHAREDTRLVKLLDLFDVLVYSEDPEDPKLRDLPSNPMKFLVEFLIARGGEAPPSKLTAAGQWLNAQDEGLEVVWTTKTWGWFMNQLKSATYHKDMSSAERDLWMSVGDRFESVKVEITEENHSGRRYKWKS